MYAIPILVFETMDPLILLFALILACVNSLFIPLFLVLRTFPPNRKSSTYHYLSSSIACWNKQEQTDTKKKKTKERANDRERERERVCIANYTRASAIGNVRIFRVFVANKESLAITYIQPIFAATWKLEDKQRVELFKINRLFIVPLIISSSLCRLH